MKKLYIESDGELHPTQVASIVATFDALKVVKPSKKKLEKGEDDVGKKD